MFLPPATAVRHKIFANLPVPPAEYRYLIKVSQTISIKPLGKDQLLRRQRYRQNLHCKGFLGQKPPDPVVKRAVTKQLNGNRKTSRDRSVGNDVDPQRARLSQNHPYPSVIMQRTQQIGIQTRRIAQIAVIMFCRGGKIHGNIDDLAHRYIRSQFPGLDLRQNGDPLLHIAGSQQLKRISLILKDPFLLHCLKSLGGRIQKAFFQRGYNSGSYHKDGTLLFILFARESRA